MGRQMRSHWCGCPRSRVVSMQKVRWVLLLTMAAASSLAASTVLEMTPAELVSGASTILTGVAARQDTYTVNGTVWTFTRYDVDEVLKGTPTSEYTIAQYGGSRGNIRYTAAGLANLQIGEKYLLILDNT